MSVELGFAWRVFILLIGVVIPSAASAVHGTALVIRPTNNIEIVVVYDPEDVSAPSEQYMNSNYGFIRDALATVVENEQAFRKIQNSLTVVLDFGHNGEVFYSASKEDGDNWELVEEQSYGKLAGNRMFVEIVCVELLMIECAESVSSERIVAFDRMGLEDLGNLPIVSVGDFPLSPKPALNVYTQMDEISSARSNEFISAESLQRTQIPRDIRFSGSADDAIDYLSRQGQVPLDERNALPSIEADDINVPFERSGSLKKEMDIKPGFDNRLRYIVLHCTGPGVMPRSAVERYASSGKRNKGHGYIMMDGSYIKVASIKENPNRTYATKTETCLREEAFGSMFNIELNYDCHWRPEETREPPDSMIDTLAEVIVWVHENVGPLTIASHTYVDMGLKRGHTDPQGNPGFDWEDLYMKIESKGGDLSIIEKIDPHFATKWPISLTDRAHQFPPVLSGTLLKGTDECDKHAGN